MNTTKQNILYPAWLALKIVYGLIVLIAGIDKFLFLLSPNTEHVISSFVKALLPIKVIHFIYAIGIFEIILGGMILTTYTYWGALLLMLWYIIININLFTIGPAFYLLILGNTGHAVANFALASLTKFLYPKNSNT